MDRVAAQQRHPSCVSILHIDRVPSIDRAVADDHAVADGGREHLSIEGEQDAMLTVLTDEAVLDCQLAVPGIEPLPAIRADGAADNDCFDETDDTDAIIADIPADQLVRVTLTNGTDSGTVAGIGIPYVVIRLY